MSIDALPIEAGLNYYEYEIELDDVQFRLEFRFNDRDEAWYLSISDANGTHLRMGLRIVPQSPLLNLWAGVERPGGEMIGVSRGTSNKTPVLDELGTEVILTYLDEAEVTAIG